MKTELIALAFLNLRSAIADKELNNMNAQHDLSRYGEMTCDYNSIRAEIDMEIKTHRDEIEKLLNPDQPQEHITP